MTQYQFIISKTCQTQDAEGIAIERYEYDLYDALIKECRFDENDKLLEPARSFCCVMYERDPGGNVLGKTFYDNLGYPMNNGDSIAQIINTYDRNGNLSSTDSIRQEVLFDENPGRKDLSF
ncbi:hypothetical protein FNH22_18515 [Fulvivirga sp. M361]|uniref:hypothetical protein n=1 Tax=Fulvivirga sp. M361 TaxID=2594266 RepID=UPI00117AC42E|nr:hypothetical protein [Fulvivirga sp. M361]TRX54758.1 hypothetical protein FNH22_18515 [Fulvivirga sp. M361]